MIPQAMIAFKLPEENSEYQINIMAQDMYSALCDIQRHLRNKMKYSELTDEQFQIYDNMQKEFFQCLDEHKVSLEL